MKLKDQKIGGYHAGRNSLYLKEYNITDGQYGKQLEMTFTPELEMEKEKVFKYWHGFSDKFSEADSWKFTTKLEELTKILASYIGEDAAQARYQVVKSKLFEEDFDNEDKEAVQKLQERFLVGLLKALPENYKLLPCDVILHYNAEGFLNIPKYKDNNFQIPIGLNTVMSKKLNMVKPEYDREEGAGAGAADDQSADPQVDTPAGDNSTEEDW